MVRSTDRQRLWSACILNALHGGVHVADHVRSLGLLLSHARAQSAPVYAHATLARGAFESAALVRWLLADGEPFATRFGRGIALLAEDTGNAARAAGQLAGTAYLPAPALIEERRKKEFLARLTAAQIETTLNASETITHVRVVGGTEPLSVKTQISTLVKEAFATCPPSTVCCPGSRTPGPGASRTVRRSPAVTCPGEQSPSRSSTQR